MKAQREVPEPPAHLSEKAKALWREVVPRRCRSPERIALLEVALRSLDRADMAAAAIESEGMITKTETTGAVHVHPLVKVERESRQLFARIWGSMSLEWDYHLDGGNK